MKHGLINIGSKPLARFAAVAMCVSVSACGVFSTSSTYEDAASAYEAGQYRIANAHIVDILANDEGDERTRLLQLQLMLAMADGNRAMAAIDQLPEAALGGVYRRVALAHAQILQGKAQKTFDIYETLAREEFTEQDYRMQLWALRDLGKADEFKTVLEAAISRFPNSPQINALAADQFYDQRALDDAGSFANTAVEYGPDVLEARLVAGRKSIFEGDLEGAIVHYKRANELNPTNALPVTNVVGLHLDLGQVEEAGEALGPALEIHSDHPFLQWQLARYKLAIGDVQGAREAKDSIERIYYDNPEFMLLMADIEAAFGNKKLALDSYRRFVEEVGEVPEIMDKIAELES